MVHMGKSKPQTVDAARLLSGLENSFKKRFTVCCAWLRFNHNNMIRTSIVLEQKTIEWLNDEAKQNKRSFAYVVREKLESLQPKKKTKSVKR